MRYSDRIASRHGTILPLLAVTCFSLFAFVALAVDIGMLMVARTECQNAADTAALTGARTLDNNVPDGTPESSYNNQRPAAVTAATGGANIGGVKGNYLLTSTFAFNDMSTAWPTAVHPTYDRVEIGIYDYDSTAQVFKAIFPALTANPDTKLTGSNGTVRPWTACRITVKGDQPTYFARIFGVTTMPMMARATAVHRPRDIAMVLDYSGSMNFGGTSHYPSGDGSSSGAVIGLLSPDPRFPQFGHYQRYDGRQMTDPNAASPHPLRMLGNYTMTSGEILSSNNQTYESSGGPPMVNDFYTSTLTSPTAAVNTANLVSAFQTSVMPTDTSYNTQAIAFATTARGGQLGDRWPRKGGVRTDTGLLWDRANAGGAARNVAELLFANTAAPPATPTERALPTVGTPTPPTTVSSNTKHGATSWAGYYDNAWERLGYDLDIPTYIKDSGNVAYRTANARTTELFQGYTLGPGYWGKSFFVWPPDPRFNTAASLTNLSTTKLSQDSSNRDICDWRRRFFLKSDSTVFNPQVDNINALLLSPTVGGHVLNVTTSGVDASVSTGFRVNYPAVLAWLKSGPQTMPANLRAGRILFYTEIPNDCTTPANDNERFWREYIDYVLGVTVNRTWYNPAYCLAGVEPTSWAGSTPTFPATTKYTPTGSSNANPKPYMNYTDTPNMPRAHFWFGPSSFLMFLTTRGQFTGSKAWNYNPGTVREAQCWQLKAAMQSCIDDIRKNHPNDQCGLSFFAYSNFRTPRVNMGQDWDRLKAALFFPYSFLDDVVAGNVREERPFSSTFNPRLVGNLPNANGATDPNNGLALAFNMLGNSSTSTSNGTGFGGRKGASKIVIFETDGVPNSYQNWDLAGTGSNTRYDWIDDGSSPGNGDSTSMTEAYNVVQQIVKSTTASSPGYSLPNAPARVYPFAFGDMFTSTSSFKPTAFTFLQTIGYHGNTNTSTSTTLPSEQVITGNYDTRINNLRTGLERCLQNGVQVTLIE